jgi:hypothetical protein
MLRELAVSINRNRSRSVSVAEGGSTGLSGLSGLSASSSAAGDNVDMLYGPGDDDDGFSAFEGDSSMTAQAAFASEFLEHAVTRTLPHDLDPDMRSALSSLQQIVNMQNRPSAPENRFANAKPLPKGGLRELPMPPAHVVVSALREAKGCLLHSTRAAWLTAGNLMANTGGNRQSTGQLHSDMHLHRHRELPGTV